MTTREIAARYRIAVGTLENWRSMGIGPSFVKTPTGRILYRASVVEAWVTSATPEAVAA